MTTAAWLLAIDAHKTAPAITVITISWTRRAMRETNKLFP
jgi:hypothetical protein